MTIEFERSGRVAVLTINRPEARNAIDGATGQALSDAFDQAEADPGVWAVVLTGAGDKAFCAGADLKALATGRGGEGIFTAGGFANPLIAAVNGAALAGGLEIMLACDFAVAAEHATFGIPEVKRGIIAGAGGLLRLPNRLPMSVALELAMTGERIDAHQALGFGLVNRVVPAGAALEATIATARLICDNAPLAVRASKRLTLAAVELQEELWDLNDATVLEVMRSADAREGPLAFAEKRPPRWTGR
jgi:enoyl-CoA hydratase/carnithine racemase